MVEIDSKKAPTILQALIPVLTLVILLAASVYLFADDSSYGPNQIALIFAATVGTIIGARNGFSWKEMRQGMVTGVGMAMGAIFILLVVGSLIGTWILSGIVPTMIYYGLSILSPTYFLPLAVVISAIVSVATGSSWTTASTIGIALIGIASALGISLPMAAGAIISGAYFGDKLSPLSDTTNLAPAMAGTDLFTHIKHMLWTTVPSIVIALIIFTFLGLSNSAPAGSGSLDEILNALNGTFNITPWLLLAPVAVFALVLRKTPAFPALLIGSILGGVFAAIFQPEVVLNFAGADGLSRPMGLLKGVWKAFFAEFEAHTGSESLDSLLSRGGMASMLNTIWLIVSAMMFGAIMETTGLLHLLAAKIMSLAKSTGSLIFATIVTTMGTNIIASDQYIAIVLPGRMFRAEYEKRGLAPENLSRTLEDAGTITSPMVPWNTCGAFMSQALGVATLAYLPFCFFNYINPMVAATYGFTGFSIKKIEPVLEDSSQGTESTD